MQQHTTPTNLPSTAVRQASTASQLCYCQTHIGRNNCCHCRGVVLLPPTLTQLLPSPPSPQAAAAAAWMLQVPLAATIQEHTIATTAGTTTSVCTTPCNKHAEAPARANHPTTPACGWVLAQCRLYPRSKPLPSTLCSCCHQPGAVAAYTLATPWSLAGSTTSSSLHPAAAHSSSASGCCHQQTQHTMCRH